MQLKRLYLVVVLLLIGVWATLTGVAAAATPRTINDAFRQLWEYSDLAVADVLGTGRGYTWGPNIVGAFQEDYAEGVGGKRLVQYFDKSRMELSADGQQITNGLLTKELVTGNRQDGDNKYTQFAPSTSQVVGDDNANGGNSVAPTYASFKAVVSLSLGQNHANSQIGSSVRLTIDHNGSVQPLPIGVGTAILPSLITAYEPAFGHNIPKAFTDFMKLTGPVWNGTALVTGRVYTDNPTANVFGYAITEPYWTQAVVGGHTQQVLVQLFERRVLTYTPSNPKGFQVEMGNIGQHYFRWRYSLKATQPLNYVALGASDVVGVGADIPGSDSWVVQLYQQLPNHSTFTRLGISGAKLADIISQLLPQALAAHPTLVTDWSVVNDLNDYLQGKLTQAAYQSELANFLAQLVSQTSAPIFIANVPDLTALPIYKQQGVGASVLLPAQQQFNAIISAAVAKYPGRVHLVDLASWDLKSHPSWISKDGFHPSTAGYAQLAQIFLGIIETSK